MDVGRLRLWGAVLWGRPDGCGLLVGQRLRLERGRRGGAAEERPVTGHTADTLAQRRFGDATGVLAPGARDCHEHERTAFDCRRTALEDDTTPGVRIDGANRLRLCMIHPAGAVVKRFSFAAPVHMTRADRSIPLLSSEDDSTMKLRDVAVAAVVIAAASAAMAERPPQKREDAHLVIAGKVEKITTQVKKFGKTGEVTHYTAKVMIDKVEKGNDAKAGDTIEVKWFHVTKRPDRTEPIVGAFGHKYDLEEQDEARFWLRKFGAEWQISYNKDGVEKVEKK